MSFQDALAVDLRGQGGLCCQRSRERDSRRKKHSTIQCSKTSGEGESITTVGISMNASNAAARGSESET